MKSLLKQLKREEKLVSIRTAEQDWETAHVGYINALDDEFIELTLIDAETQPDGTIFFKINEIMEVSVDDRYLKRLGFLIVSRSKVSISKKLQKLTIRAGSLKDSRLIALMERKILSKVFCGDKYTIGFITAINTDYVTLTCVGYEGDDDGISYISKSAIDRLDYGDKELAKIELYHKNRAVIYSY